MAKVRIVIEYDLELEEGTAVTEDMIQDEASAWLKGEVGVRDVVQTGGSWSVDVVE